VALRMKVAIELAGSIHRADDLRKRNTADADVRAPCQSKPLGDLTQRQQVTRSVLESVNTNATVFVSGYRSNRVR
jgi:hypothetical protein